MEKEMVHKNTEKKVSSSLQKKIVILNIMTTMIISTLLLLFRNNLLFDICLALALVIGFSVFAYIRASAIIKPITAIKERLEGMAERCDFNAEAPYFETNDEIEELSGALRMVQRGLCCHTTDLIRVLNDLADYRLNTPIHCGYIGDYQQQKKAILKIQERLNAIIYEINNSILEVSAMAENVSKGAKQVSEGSVHQLTAAEQLNEHVSNVYTQIQESAKSSKNASELATKAGKRMMESTQEIHRMQEAMEIISVSSNKISDVLKNIDAISRQTKILALNASIEAARSGEAGKGFAIVAADVRDLAAKTAEASAGTEKLIEEIITVIADGKEAANQTAKVIHEVMEEAKVATGFMADISETVKTQEYSIKEISEEIKNIRQIIEINSDVAAEGKNTAKAVEEQIQLLDQIVKRFKTA